MELNNIIFPSPSFRWRIEDYLDELIFIPRKKSLYINDPKEDPSEYIPILVLLAKKEFISKNFCIFFHGNAEDIFLAREFGEKLRFYLEMNIIIVEYPGYSVYFDEKNSEKLLENSVLVFDFLVEELGVSPENIIILGRSIGTAPALYLSSKRNVEGLTLMSPFTSIKSVVESLVGKFFTFIVSERFTNLEYIKNVTSPILFIHGQKDDLIPFQHTLLLKDECKSPFEVILPEEMNHNYFDFQEDLINPMKSFLKRHTRIIENDYINSTSIIPSRFFIIPTCVRETLRKNKQEEGFSFFNCLGKN